MQSLRDERASVLAVAQNGHDPRPQPLLTFLERCQWETAGGEDVIQVDFLCIARLVDDTAGDVRLGVLIPWPGRHVEPPLAHGGFFETGPCPRSSWPKNRCDGSDPVSARTRSSELERARRMPWGAPCVEVKTTVPPSVSSQTRCSSATISMTSRGAPERSWSLVAPITCPDLFFEGEEHASALNPRVTRWVSMSRRPAWTTPPGTLPISDELEEGDEGPFQLRVELVSDVARDVHGHARRSGECPSITHKLQAIARPLHWIRWPLGRSGTGCESSPARTCPRRRLRFGRPPRGNAR